MEAQCQSMTGATTKTSQFKCPCKEDKKHLGISVIIPKISDTPPELLKVQRKFFLGHGIKTTNTEEAANIFFLCWLRESLHDSAYLVALFITAKNQLFCIKNHL